MASSLDFSDSNSDSGDGFNQDLEALKRACRLTGEHPTRNGSQLSSATGGLARDSTPPELESDGGEYGEDDLQLVRSIQERFAVSTDVDEPPLMTPLRILLPDCSDSDDCEDDYETLRAIQRRFATYNDDTGSSNTNVGVFSSGPGQVGDIVSKKESSNRFVERTNAREGFVNCVDASDLTVQNLKACEDAGGTQTFDFVEWNGPQGDELAILPPDCSYFPKSALGFVDAIKKNRSCQKLLRVKMMQMEARLEELKKLIERVKILKDFQIACKRKTGRALSQKKDPRVHLISVPKLRARVKRFNENKIPAAYKGPPENIHVEIYKETLTTFAVSVHEEKWSKEERENLVKGVKQQFQGMLLLRSVDMLSETNGQSDSSNVERIIGSIKDLDVTPEKIRSFLPKVNWDQLAAMYVPSHSGAECEARFLNFEDPLINNDPWTATEDKNLLHIVQQKGLSNWIDIAASLRTNRTPFSCLAHYQRSLNASILKREWTNEEDNQLRAAVETFGESNWQLVASAMEGRTGTQCSNRWLKTLHPARKRVGKWTAEEDKQLKVAVTLFGPKTWKKVASFVPGRTHVQCRERWVNCLDPSLNMSEWTEEEDAKLEAATADHGYCWSKVAACIPRRTDNQCWRRWKTLFPNEVPRLQAARKIQKSALISNFVDRESERPSLGPGDFILPETNCITGSEILLPSTCKKRRSRWKEARKVVAIDAPSSEVWLEEVPSLTNDSTVENMEGRPRSVFRQGNGGIGEKHSNRDGDIFPCQGTALINTCAGEEIENPSVDNVKHKMILEFEDGTHSNGKIQAIQSEHHDQVEGCFTKKACKLSPRRRNCKQRASLEPEVDPTTGMKSGEKESRMQAGVELSSISDSVSIINTGKGAGRSYKRKVKRNCQLIPLGDDDFQNETRVEAVHNTEDVTVSCGSEDNSQKETGGGSRKMPRKMMRVQTSSIEMVQDTCLDDGTTIGQLYKKIKKRLEDL